MPCVLPEYCFVSHVFTNKHKPKYKQTYSQKGVVNLVRRGVVVLPKDNTQ